MILLLRKIYTLAAANAVQYLESPVAFPPQDVQFIVAVVVHEGNLSRFQIEPVFIGLDFVGIVFGVWSVGRFGAWHRDAG